MTERPTTPPSGPAPFLIELERRRQIRKEGYDAKHDDEHDRGELGLAAIAYIAAAVGKRVVEVRELPNDYGLNLTDPWPWDDHQDKRRHGKNLRDAFLPEEELELLVKAGAMVAAEIDRRMRRGDMPRGSRRLDAEMSPTEQEAVEESVATRNNLRREALFDGQQGAVVVERVAGRTSDGLSPEARRQKAMRGV